MGPYTALCGLVKGPTVETYTGHWKATGHFEENAYGKSDTRIWILKGGTGGAPLPGPCAFPFKIQKIVQDVPFELFEKVPGCFPVASDFLIWVKDLVIFYLNIGFYAKNTPRFKFLVVES